MKAISLKNIYFKYADDLDYILKDISFDIEYGKITLLTGSSGCGKSTILYLISKIIPDVVDGIIKGDIYINENDTIEKSVGAISKEVGLVIQNPDKQIISDIVEDEIAFGCENLGFSKSDIKKQVIKYSDLLELKLSKQTRSLSGGEKERLILASVFSMKQKIILLDEPLANLDSKSIEIVINNLKILKDNGCAILVSEHRLNYLKDIVDKTLLLDKSTIKEVNIRNCLKKYSDIKLEKTPKNKTDDILLSLNNIGKKFYKTCVINDISFDVFKGDKILILGNNGCGKTTLLKIIAKIIKPNEGVYIQNIEKSQKQKRKGNKAWFRKVGYIFQNPNYQLFMPSVYEELSYSAKDKNYLEYLIDKLNLRPLLNYHPQALSEGQKRRLTVATILASKPKLLLFDEPTVGQDDENLQRLIDVIDDFYKRFDATIIAITHDYRFAKSLNDKVLIMDREKGLIKGDNKLLEEYFKTS